MYRVLANDEPFERPTAAANRAWGLVYFSDFRFNFTAVGEHLRVTHQKLLYSRGIRLEAWEVKLIKTEIRAFRLEEIDHAVEPCHYTFVTLTNVFPRVAHFLVVKSLWQLLNDLAYLKFKVWVLRVLTLFTSVEAQLAYDYTNFVCVHECITKTR